MNRIASAVRVALYDKLDNLTPEQNQAYRDQRATELTRAVQANDGNTLSQESLDALDNHLLERILNGAPHLDQAGYQALVDEYETAAYARQIRLRERAANIVKAENTAPPAALPGIVQLKDLLEEPDEEIRYRIDGLLPTGGNCILAAQYKAGKSSAVGNAVRSLVDGDPFLDKFPVQPVTGETEDGRPGTVVLIDNELDPRTLKRWLRDQGIKNTHLVEVVSLRGNLSTFNLIDPDTRKAWAHRIEGADVVILDCLRPVLDALGLDENLDAGQFLIAWDEFLAEAMAGESIIVHHMGHNSERQRGSSRLLDWPDVTWKIVRADEDPSSPRFFSAFGRDVDVPEGGLEYDPATRHLSYTDGNRREGAAGNAMPALLELLTQHSALSGRQIEEHLMPQGHPQKAIRAALKKARAEGRTITYSGPHRATMHSLDARHGKTTGTSEKSVANFSQPTLHP
ncbi:AAA family ATPase [Arthrobacter sp. FW306-05-C]|uniref:AAA family ATPase n=1 Tax=Arthrobacter sp. FW306-05-C TaxID=2879620 RepID=UPI001F3BE258|nr:AAA family ATPase [Arthrobacter sp. FW306-05-C]UKA65438.1 AAA family ATPase [Arthrobacter sp. FW306-05-C]